MGSGYVGEMDKSISGASCSNWEAILGNLTNRDKYHFIDGNLGMSRNRCRNPDDNPSGPYCFVGSENNKERCDIPKCCKLIIICIFAIIAFNLNCNERPTT